MNEALPQWRSFTSAAVEPQPAADITPGSPGQVSEPASLAASAPRSASGSRSLAMLAMAALGGAAAGGALVLLGVALLGLPAGGPAAATSTGVDRAELSSLIRDDASWQEGTGAQAAVQRSEIVVDVAGAVALPGVLRLHDGDRVADAIAAAGGYGPRVDLAAAARSLNLAQPLADGSKVIVPELGIGPVEASGSSASGLIDLNTADQAALESLPGIGPVTAGKIMSARSERPFSAVGDLLERGLVGESVFEDIAGQVQVGG